MKLYEIDKTLESLVESGFVVDEETGELLFTADDIEALQMEKDNKVENLCLMVKNYSALQENIANEIKTLQERKGTLGKRIERLKNFLALTLNGNKFETAKVKVSYRKSKPVDVSGVDIENLPDEYVILDIKKSADKTKIKKAIESGIEIAGCSIVEKTNVIIK